MTMLEAHVLKSLDCNLHGQPVEDRPLTLQEFTAVAIALRAKGLVGTQRETLVNDWTGTSRVVLNSIWLTREGREAVEAL